MEDKLTEIKFPLPEDIERLSNSEVLFGAPIPAIDRLKIISADAFEDLVREWVIGFLMKKGKYVECKRCSGAGDKGRDVIAYINKTDWDNYQCKHYGSSLSPTDIYIELGKLCYYTYLKEYSLPTNYYFMSPKGIGAKLNGYFEKPDVLKKEFLANWDEHCSEKITSKKKIELKDDFKSYIDGLDFAIFKGYDPQLLVDNHQQTTYHAGRFGGGLLKKRNLKIVPPTIIQISELEYTNQLFKAYSDHKKTSIKSISDIENNDELNSHFIRQRQGFYSADSLNQFSRDTLPPGNDYFSDLKSEFHEGIVDVITSVFPDAYEKIKATTNLAKTLVINMNPLAQQLIQSDRVGICHHLVNEKKIKWM